MKSKTKDDHNYHPCKSFYLEAYGEGAYVLFANQAYTKHL